jgi:hypothetical protein
MLLYTDSLYDFVMGGRGIKRDFLFEGRGGEVGNIYKGGDGGSGCYEYLFFFFFFLEVGGRGSGDNLNIFLMVAEVVFCLF